MKSIYLKLSAAGMLILTVFSLYFYKERTLFLDTAYYLFRMSLDGSFNIELNRWAALLPEILPLMSMYFQLPVAWVLISFSLSFWLIFSFVFYLCVYKLKSPESGIAIVLGFTLFLRQSYFHSVTETHQAVVYSILLYAWLMYANPERRFLYAGLAFIISLAGFFSHPVSLFMQVFAIAYACINRNLFKNAGIGFVLVFLGMLYIAKVVMTNPDTYEGGFFTEVKRLPELLPSLLTSHGVQHIRNDFFKMYIWPAIMGCTLVFVYGTQKKWLHLLLFTFGSGFFLMITLAAYNQGDAVIMTEKNYMPFAVFLVLPFARDFLLYVHKSAFLNYSKLVFFTLLLCMGIVSIFLQGEKQIRRTHWLKCMIDNTKAMGIQKSYVLKDNYEGITWALSHETLWYSSLLYGKDQVATVYSTATLESLPPDIIYDDLYLSTQFWTVYSVNSLHPTYFKFRPGQYQHMRDVCPGPE